MCGIFCKWSEGKKEISESHKCEHTRALLYNRGPNKSGHHFISTSCFEIFFRGHVLWQQGSQPCSQPLVQGEHILLMNGDIYTDRPSRDISDTEFLMNKIVACKNEVEFLKLFTTVVKGPFSIIYYNIRTECLYFMRDSLGRQTLLLGYHHGELVITSVSTKLDGTKGLVEVPPLGIFKWKHTDGRTVVSLHPWQEICVHDFYKEQLSLLQDAISVDIVINASLQPLWLQNRAGNTSWTFAELLPENYDVMKSEDIFKSYLFNSNIRETCNKINDILDRSVKERCEATPSMCKSCYKANPNGVSCDHPKIGILFSGGIDCTILAVLADRYVGQACAIDLINVSFEKVRQTPLQNQEAINYSTPDRLTSRETLDELKLLCPKRVWNLVEVNVNRAELKASLESRISHLVYPLCTVLDESIGAALWFAASGRGHVNEIPYESPCRVLLIGSGADELFGGYTRHRNAFIRNGSSWSHLNDELYLDWVRLPSRNLARDDRVIGDWGITARSPYVHEDLSELVRNLGAEQKCMHLLDQGVGDKLLLRLCAYQLKLRGVCALRKRALQFGSRIADGRQNAKHKSTALE